MVRRGRALVLATLAAAAAALAVTGTPVVARSRAVTPIGGLPAYSHVALIVLENESESTTFGVGSPAVYLNALTHQAAFDPTYYATGHVSLDNYIEMVSGQPANPLSSTDCLAVNLYTCVQPQTLMANGRNLADQLEGAGLTWRGYMDGMPSPCFHADYSPTAQPPDPYQGNSTAAPAYNYADRHNPFNYFPDIITDQARCASHVVPYTALPGDLAADRLPAFSFITPDTCHDGHDSPCANGQPGGLTSADAWLRSEVPPLLSYMAAHNGLLLITFDEGSTSTTTGCCAGGPGGTAGFGGQVGLLALGPHTRAGATVATAYDHASLLRTFEQLFGITEYLNNAASSTAMADLFTTTAAAGTGTPTASASAAPTTADAARSLANTSGAAGGGTAAALATAAAGVVSVIGGRRRRQRVPRA